MIGQKFHRVIISITVFSLIIPFSGMMIAEAAGDVGTVESFKKIIVGGLGANDKFGISVGTIGELDGDNDADILVGADGDDDIGAQAGAVYILKMNTDGTAVLSQKQPAGGGGFNTAANDRFGTSITGIGDLDNDGNEDFAVGAPFDESNARGAVYIVFMNPDGTVRGASTVKLVSGTPNVGPFDQNANFGKSMAGLGDLDGDGFEDIIVGLSVSGPYRILNLDKDGNVIGVTLLTNGNGQAVANLGDLDGPGGTPLALAVSLGNSVRILFMNPAGTVNSSIDIGNADLVGTVDPGDGFGNSIAGPGDLNGDGIPDLVVGAPNDDDGGTDRGAVWILFLNNDGTVKSEQKISDIAGDFSGVGNPGGVLVDDDFFGSSVTKIEDNAGNSAFAVGATGDGDNIGALYILFIGGPDDNMPPVLTLIGQNPAIVNPIGFFADEGATAIDDTDGNISANIVKTTTVQIGVPGQYTVTYNVSDAAGNAATPITRSVIIDDEKSAPTVVGGITCPKSGATIQICHKVG